MQIVQKLGLPVGTLNKTREVYQTDPEIKAQCEAAIKKTIEDEKIQNSLSSSEFISEADTLRLMAKRELDLQRLQRFVEIEKSVVDGRIKIEQAKFLLKIEMAKTDDRMNLRHGIDTDLLLKSAQKWKTCDCEEWSVVKEEIEQTKNQLKKQLEEAIEK